MSPAQPGETPAETPYSLVGGEPKVRALVADFYAAMARDEPALARLHACDSNGLVEQPMQDRFALFLVGWLGGPQDYMAQHGHPRLRMRHARVLVDEASRDAWLRCMRSALDAQQIGGEVRRFLDGRFAEVADFLRNGPQ